MLRLILVAAAALLAIVAAGALAIYAGVYNVAADIPHTKLVYWLAETARNARSRFMPEDSLFQATSPTPNALSQAPGTMPRCVPAATSLPA